MTRSFTDMVDGLPVEEVGQALQNILEAIEEKGCYVLILASSIIEEGAAQRLADSFERLHMLRHLDLSKSLK